MCRCVSVHSGSINVRCAALIRTPGPNCAAAAAVPVTAAAPAAGTFDQINTR